MQENNLKRIKDEIQKEIATLRAIEYIITKPEFELTEAIELMIKSRDLKALRQAVKQDLIPEEMSLTELRRYAKKLHIPYYTKFTRQTLISNIKELLELKRLGSIYEQKTDSENSNGILLQSERENWSSEFIDEISGQRLFNAESY